MFLFPAKHGGLLAKMASWYLSERWLHRSGKCHKRNLASLESSRAERLEMPLKGDRRFWDDYIDVSGAFVGQNLSASDMYPTIMRLGVKRRAWGIRKF